MNLSRKENAELTRQKIIDAAFCIVGESGYEALTSNALINQAGIAKGTLYHHFDKLEDVIFAMIDRMVQDLLASVPAEQYDTMRDYLDALGEYDRNMLKQNPQLINIIFGFIPKGMQDPQYQQLARNHINGAMSQIAPSIQQFYDGKLSDQQIDHAIRMIDMFCFGYCVHTKITEDEETYTQIWQEFSDMLIFYLDNLAHNKQV